MANRAHEITAVFQKNSFLKALEIILTDPSLKSSLNTFMSLCNNYVSDGVKCGSYLLTLATAKHIKLGFEIKTLKGTKAHISSENFISLIRNHGINGLNINFNNPLGIGNEQNEVSRNIINNFGNWAFSFNTPITEAGRTLLGKEMNIELRELGIQVLRLAYLTSKKLTQLKKLANKNV